MVESGSEEGLGSCIGYKFLTHYSQTSVENREEALTQYCQPKTADGNRISPYAEMDTSFRSSVSAMTSPLGCSHLTSTRQGHYLYGLQPSLSSRGETLQELAESESGEGLGKLYCQRTQSHLYGQDTNNV